jgi:hypothetical protein
MVSLIRMVDMRMADACYYLYIKFLSNKWRLANVAGHLAWWDADGFSERRHTRNLPEDALAYKYCIQGEDNE